MYILYIYFFSHVASDFLWGENTAATVHDAAVYAIPAWQNKPRPIIITTEIQCLHLYLSGFI